MPETTDTNRAGAKAYKKLADQMAAVAATRRSNRERQKAARDLRAYDDFPGTLEDLVAYHRQLREDFLTRQAARRTAR
jgi:hypothetical protein